MCDAPRGGSVHGRPRYSLDLLVSVSARVFSEHGYDGTSMADLSRATGLAKSAIYHYVDGKEQLLRLALDRAVGPLLAFAAESRNGPGPAVDRLSRLMSRQVLLLTDELPCVALLLRVRGNTETERWALDRRRAFDRCVAGLVQEAIDEGDVTPVGDARLVSRLLSGMINSLVEWYQRGACPEESDGADGGREAEAARLAREVVRMAFEGLGAVPVAAPPP
ncbi:TetR/AcrR family transcriptional regulator [Streptomyces sp. NPDC004609]|uniref:TetR/AcrR family transcriptional regulator n=1 Tax=Streptomyces sp. NPDC004609 TaxID=3364704 RepID=UPI0036969C91